MCVDLRRSESEPALDAQLRLRRPLDLLVDPPDLLLGQSSLHVAVDDAVAVTPPARPETHTNNRIVSFYKINLQIQLKGS